MKIVILHGQSHEGSTCMVARKLADKVTKRLKEESVVQEFFFPRDFSEACLGCYTCYNSDLSHCPHFEKLQPVTDAMLAADLLILASPVYAYHATGAMMNFLDHLGTWWIIHRVRLEMMSKQAVVISTAAGGGMKSTCQDMADSLEMWGVRKLYRLGFGVQAMNPSQIPAGIQKRIEKKTDRCADKITKSPYKKNMNKRAKKWFYFVRMMHKHFPPAEPDYGYWEKRGWHAKSRPWK